MNGAPLSLPVARRRRPQKLPRIRVPKMLRHSSGQARVKLAGTIHYLGQWGSPEAHARYGSLVAQYLASGKRPIAPAPTVPEATLTLGDLLRLFREWIDSSGRYLKAGRPTTSRQLIADVASSLGDFAGNVPVAKLNEALLVQWRDRIEGNQRLTRKGINRKVSMLLAILRWGRARGYVPKVVWADCSAIEPLKRGECGNRPETGRPRRAPSFAEIEKVATAAPRCIGAMLRVQALTGMRPGEVCKMRWADVDKAGPVVDGIATWIYTVHEGKTCHHGQQTRYALPPAAQAILAEFPAMPTAFVFSPHAAMAERRARLRAERKTPETKQTRDRDANAQHDYADQWDANAYRHAVEDACARAKVDRFTPHEVRHSFATWAAAALGVMTASVALNHRNLSTTQRYLHPDPSEVFKAAAAVQKRVTG